jgi:hypothetical protein
MCYLFTIDFKVLILLPFQFLFKQNTIQIEELLHLTINNVQTMFATNSIIQYCYLLPLVKVYFSAY